MKPVATFSLVRRLVLFAAAASALFVAVGAGLMAVMTGPLSDDVAEAQALQVATVYTALAQAPADRRERLAVAFGRVGIHVWPVPQMAFEELPPDLMGAAAEELPPHLRRAVDPAVHLYTIDRRGPGPGAGPSLHGHFRLEDLDWRVAVMRRPPPAAWPSLPALALLLAGVLAMGVVAAAAVFGQRLVVRPAARVARQLLDRRDRLRPIEPKGPVSEELQELVGAFNQLVKTFSAADDDRRHMLAGLSHDLRTPLARLRLRAECQVPEDVARLMERDFDALSRIIGQFLVYAQGGAYVWQGQPEPLAELVEHVVNGYRDRHAITVHMRRERGEPAQVPELAMTRVLSNLIDNAIAHGRPPFEVTVEVDARECRVLVYDGGRGIRTAELPHVLGPFVKLRGDPDALGHCGLGLTIVAQIARQLGGDVVLRPYDGIRSGIGVAFSRAGAAFFQREAGPGLGAMPDDGTGAAALAVPRP